MPKLNVKALFVAVPCLTHSSQSKHQLITRLSDDWVGRQRSSLPRVNGFTGFKGLVLVVHLFRLLSQKSALQKSVISQVDEPI